MTLYVHCDKCGTDTWSELDKWTRWYTAGEVFWDTCAGCGTRYEVEIRVKRAART